MFTFIDLFAGIGGFRLGLESLGGECVFSSEIDKHAATTYESNFGETPAGDITKIEAREIPEHDVICGGFPCQPFSISGKRLGFEDARGTLFFEVMRIIKHHKPKAVFLENVANYVTHRKGETLRVTMGVLESEGYSVRAEVLNASDYGIPQARKRLYIVGIRKDLEGEPFEYPEKVANGVSLKSLLVSNKEAKGTQIKRDDISIDKVDVDAKLKRNPNRPLQIGKINKGGQGERVYSVEGHAITLSAHGGGAAAKTGAYLVDGVVRKLHPVECRRLMGFPESFKIDPRKGQAYKQFGNAVIAPMVEKIGAEMLKAAQIDRAYGLGSVAVAADEASVEVLAESKAGNLELPLGDAINGNGKLFPHERLAVYRRSVEFVTWVQSVSNESSIVSQLKDASAVIVLSIADACSRKHKKTRAKFIEEAQTAASECAACLDLCRAMNLVDDPSLSRARHLLEAVSEDLQSC